MGVLPQEEDDEPFEEKKVRLVAKLRQQQEEARRLDEMIWRNLEALGYNRDVIKTIGEREHVVVCTSRGGSDQCLR